MKILLTILLLTSAVSAQEYRLIPELSGEVYPNNPGIVMNVSAAQIARNGDLVKLAIRLEFPWGYPLGILKVPQSMFDVSSISKIETLAEFNCHTLSFKSNRNAATVWTFNGRKLRSKEPPFHLAQEHVFSQYFCEFAPPMPASNELPKLRRAQ